MAAQPPSNKSRILKFGFLFLITLLVAGAAWFGVKHLKGDVKAPAKGVPQPLEQVKSTRNISKSYDTIVVGTDPEGIAAALSAARNGLKTLLVDGRDRPILGGLMTVGWLNSIDMNYEPGDWPKKVMNKGIFSEWFNQIEGDSFDVHTAANVFYNMVRKEKNIDLLMQTKAMEPLVEKHADGSARITGLSVTKADGTKQDIAARSVIDATQDADIAAAAGVPYTVGREDLGEPGARMAVTLVFRLSHVTDDVWKQIQKRLKNDGDAGTDANSMSAWGYGEMKDYPSTNPDRVRMRGLNIGRQNDDTALVNSLQIFGVDGLDPKSRQEAIELGKKELPHVVDYMKKKYPEFAGVELDGTAPELYVRETRHIEGEYRLSIIDVLENRDQWDRIAFGSYPVDIQRMSPADSGLVVCAPEKYAIPFRSIVPQRVDGLLVVGRSASFDSLPHGSARVIPVGMATGQAAGAAAKLAQEKGVTFRALAQSKELVAELQARINKQGMDIHPFSIKPYPFMANPAYDGLKAVVSMGLAGGGYKNDFPLDKASSANQMAGLLAGTLRENPGKVKAPGDPFAMVKGLDLKQGAPLTLEVAVKLIAGAVGETPTLDGLTGAGYLQSATIGRIADKEALTTGEAYLLIKDLEEALKARPQAK